MSGGDESSVAAEGKDRHGHEQQHVIIAPPQSGRPKGRTESNSREVHARITLATIASAKEYKVAIEKRKNGKHQQQLQKGHQS